MINLLIRKLAMWLGGITKAQFLDIANLILDLKYAKLTGKQKLEYVIEHILDKFMDDASSDYLAHTIAQLAFTLMRRKGEV